MKQQQLITDVRHAFRRNLIPGLILQTIAISMALAYYFWPSAAPVFAFWAGLKSNYGLLYAATATAIFGGLIPYLALYFSGNIRSNSVKQLFFYLIFWAVKGIEVDLFYRLQGHLFGNSNAWQTVAIKTFIDQLFYAPLWMVPTISLAYLWKEAGFSYQRFRQQLSHDFLVVTLPTITISNWLVWLPAVTVIYLMPADLQVPLFNLVQCFFVLLLHMLSNNEETTP